jgi:hypothetical protein
MTRRKQPWGEQRGWIVPADGSPPQELSPHIVGHKLISWPGTMPERQPAEPVKYLASKDYYHRHVLNRRACRSTYRRVETRNPCQSPSRTKSDAS